jgi:hypothetical protein
MLDIHTIVPFRILRPRLHTCASPPSERPPRVRRRSARSSTSPRCRG